MVEVPDFAGRVVQGGHDVDSPRQRESEKHAREPELGPRRPGSQTHRKSPGHRYSAK